MHLVLGYDASDTPLTWYERAAVLGNVSELGITAVLAASKSGHCSQHVEHIGVIPYFKVAAVQFAVNRVLAVGGVYELLNIYCHYLPPSLAVCPSRKSAFCSRRSCIICGPCIP